MKSLRLIGASLLCVVLLVSLGAVVSGQGASGTPARGGVVPLRDPTAPTAEQRLAAEERARWEREFDRDYLSRRYYWRPVLRVGQDYALRAGETVRSVTVAFGGARIEGRIQGDLVVIFGPVTLGKTAVVEGSFVVIGGTADVQPGAMVRDEVMAIGAQLDVPDGFIFGGQHVVVGTRALGRWMESVVPWVTYGLLWGRPIVASIGWVWSVVGMFLLIYLLINLVAHEPVTATAGVLATRPFGSFMTGLLVLLLAGPVSALLAVSIIGIAVIPFALAALVVAGFVGRVGVLRWLGNTVLPGEEPNSRAQGLRAFAIGFVLVTLTYMVPMLGLVAWALFGVLGLGAAVLAFLMAWRREHPKVEKPARVRKGSPITTPPQEPSPSGGYAYAAPTAPVLTQTPGFGSGPATFAGPEPTDWQPSIDPAGAASFGGGAGAAAAVMPSASTSELAQFPRAAFLDRAAAFVVDGVLVLFIAQLLERPMRYGYGNDDLMFPLLLAYFVAFWAWKGTTIGGIVVNLRVVKVNGGDLSFLEALVRGLTSVLSFGALGIGVLWILRNDLIASDGRPARQAWHDLAAGTYVVKVPEGLSVALIRINMSRMGLLMRDLKSALRLLRSQPGFSIVAVLTLAVGIGLSTTLFTVIHAAVLRPFPISDPEQLMRIDVRFPPPQGDPITTTPSLQDVRDWRAGTTLFSHIAMDRQNRSQVVDAGQAERLTVRWVSEDYFELFDIHPVIGRSLSVDDARGDAPAVVLLGHRYWQARFGGDRAIVGRQIRIDNQPFTIIGVVPAGFNAEVAVWQPLRYTPDFERRRGTGAPVIGRLRPGVTMAAAQVELSRFANSTTPGTETLFESVFDDTVEGSVSSARTLAGAVGAILLMACVNVAGLLLARGAARRRELAVRASLGASRLGLVRQLLVESLVLALAGGVVGVLLAWVSMDTLLAIIPIAVPETALVSLNFQVLLFSASLAVATVLIFGVLPAMRLSRVDVAVALAGAERHAGAALSRRSGQALIAIEVALAVIVLAGAGLMVRSFSRLMSVDLGFDPSSFVTMEAAPVDPSPAVAAAYYPALLRAVRALPGVMVAGAANQLPIGGSRRAGSIPGPDGKPVRVDHRLILPGYFEAAGMKLEDGRVLTDSDLSSGRSLLVINASAAKKLFPGTRAVGQVVSLAEQTSEIVGVIADVLQDGARSPVRPNVYALYTGREVLGRAPFAIFVRPAPGASNLASQLRETALRIGPKVVVDHIRPGSAFVAEEVTMPRQRMQLLGLVGVVALAMTLVGIFSVTSYAVARRTREIGVRMALGARPKSAVAAIIRDAAWPVAIGLVAGLTGAYFLTRVLSSFLFNTSPQDPATFTAASVLLAVAALTATWWPARRAAMIDPITALRTD